MLKLEDHLKVATGEADAEVLIEFSAADMYGTIRREGKVWLLSVVDTGFDDSMRRDEPQVPEKLDIDIASDQAGAIMWLFITGGEDEVAESISRLIELHNVMYHIAETAVEKLPSNLRPIP